MARNPSYPHQAIPRVTMNPLLSLRSATPAKPPLEPQQGSEVVEVEEGKVTDGIANLMDTAEYLSAAKVPPEQLGPDVGLCTSVSGEPTVVSGCCAMLDNHPTLSLSSSNGWLFLWTVNSDSGVLHQQMKC